LDTGNSNKEKGLVRVDFHLMQHDYEMAKMVAGFWGISTKGQPRLGNLFTFLLKDRTSKTIPDGLSIRTKTLMQELFSLYNGDVDTALKFAVESEINRKKNT